MTTITLYISSIDENTNHGSSICNGGGGTNIIYNGYPVSEGISNCNIKIEEIQKSHNGTWKCLANSLSRGVYSDTINITTIGNHDVEVPLGVILGTSIPICVLLIVIAILLLIWCCCPVYLALCCCCIPACREKSEEAGSRKTHYTQTDRRRYSSGQSSVGIQSNLPPLPQSSRR